MNPNSTVTLGPDSNPVLVGNSQKLSIIAGPCQLESRSHAFDMAGALKETCAKLGVGLTAPAPPPRAASGLRTRCRSFPTFAGNSDYPS